MAELLALMIPITGIVGGFLIAYAHVQARQRRREMLHAERVRAMELGMELPDFPEEDQAVKGDPYGNLKAAIILLFLSGSFIIIGETTSEKDLAVPSLLFGGLGFAFLLIHLIIPKAAHQKDKTPPTKPSASTTNLSPMSKPVPPPVAPNGASAD